MTTVITTRDIPTLAGVIRAGVLLSVVSWCENGAANLSGPGGFPTVSMAPAESFQLSVVSDQEEADGEWPMANGQSEEAAGCQLSAIIHQHSETTKAQRHEGESQDCEEPQVVPVEAEMLDRKERRHVSAHPLVSDGGSADSDPITIPSATACEPVEFPTCDPVDTASENTLAVDTSLPFVPPCLSGSPSLSPITSAESDPPHVLSNYDQLEFISHAGTTGDSRDSHSAQSTGSDGDGDDSQACPFDATGVSRLPAEVSRDDRPASCPTVEDINAEFARDGGSASRYQLTREVRDQVRFARPVSGGKNGWPVMRPGNKSPEQLTITVDPESAGMPTWPRASWHPHRSHWPAPWQLAEYGVTYGGRTVWIADHPEIRPEDKPWRLAIDLDRGEVCVAGHWQRMNFTTKAQKHDDGSCDSTLRTPDSTVALDVIHQWGDGCQPERSCVAKEDLCEESSGPDSKWTTKDLRPGMQSVSESRNRSNTNRDYSGVGSDRTGLSSETSGPELSAINQWPAPHHAMTIDERRGHRRVKNERGDIVYRCGPGPGETFADFAAWIQRLDEFFEQKPSKETKGAT